MARQTGQYRIASTLGEEVRAFVPYPLPPADPSLALAGAAAELEAAAMAVREKESDCPPSRFSSGQGLGRLVPP